MKSEPHGLDRFIDRHREFSNDLILRPAVTNNGELAAPADDVALDESDHSAVVAAGSHDAGVFVVAILCLWPVAIVDQNSAARRQWIVDRAHCSERFLNRQVEVRVAGPLQNQNEIAPAGFSDLRFKLIGFLIAAGFAEFCFRFSRSVLSILMPLRTIFRPRVGENSRAGPLDRCVIFQFPREAHTENVGFRPC